MLTWHIQRVPQIAVSPLNSSLSSGSFSPLLGILTTAVFILLTFSVLFFSLVSVGQNAVCFYVCVDDHSWNMTILYSSYKQQLDHNECILYSVQLMLSQGLLSDQGSSLRGPGSSLHSSTTRGLCRSGAFNKGGEGGQGQQGSIAFGEWKNKSVSLMMNNEYDKCTSMPMMYIMYLRICQMKPY